MVGDDAEIGPFACLDGPAWIAERVRISPHAWIREGTAIGHDSRVGGEVQASVIEPLTNKPHDGYLGHSHVGSWVNIAAGTNTGNLKASYGPVRQHTLLPDGSRTTIHTHRQFLGAVVGDLAKVNVVTMAARPTLDFLRRGSLGLRRFKLLDVGFGGGVMLRRIADANMRDNPPDLLISPLAAHCGLTGYHRASELIAEGRRAADAALAGWRRPPPARSGPR